MQVKDPLLAQFLQDACPILQDFWVHVKRSFPCTNLARLTVTLQDLTPEGGNLLNLRDYSPALKSKFSNRKLFTCGSCYLTQGVTQGTASFFRKRYILSDVLMEHNTDLTSLLL